MGRTVLAGVQDTCIHVCRNGRAAVLHPGWHLLRMTLGFSLNTRPVIFTGNCTLSLKSEHLKFSGS
jgi:hypothetical protein